MKKAYIRIAGIMSALIIITIIILWSRFKTWVDISKVKLNDSIAAKIKQPDKELIPDNIWVDNVCIGGIAKKEAYKKISEYVKTLREKNVTLYVNSNKHVVTLKELGFDTVKNDYIENASMIGKIGLDKERYDAVIFAKQNEMHYKLNFGISQSKLKKFIIETKKKYDILAKEPSLKRCNGKFKYTEGKNGRHIHAKEIETKIKHMLLKNWNYKNVKFKVQMKADKPQFTMKDIKRCNDILGKYTTTYQHSSKNRAANLDNAAKLLNNIVVYPGEEFSAQKYLAPFTKENGYQKAKVFSSGKVTDGVGGGTCQVVTTLYNAALKAELDITQRHPHSMTVSYVDLARDATITGTYKDLKFKNNTDSPILIESYTTDKSITFCIWGNETRPDNRVIQFETVVKEQSAPLEDVVIIDRTKPESYRKVTQLAHIGFKAELYKIISCNGRKVTQEKINESEYESTPRYITIGIRGSDVG